VLSVTNGIFAAESASTILAFDEVKSGLTIKSRIGGIPHIPEIPAPRIKLRSTVSRLSVELCATATAAISFLLRFISSKQEYLAFLAASSKPTDKPRAILGTSILFDMNSTPSDSD
jgi:hypothetical protein